MDALIDPLTGDYAGQQIQTLANAVYLRLFTRVGSWWADPQLGSRLHELQRMKDVHRIYKLAKQYSEQALQPIIDDGRASGITVTATRAQPGRCLLHIEVVDVSGRTQLFTHHVEVS
ncbi:MAG: hypothetical protein CL536_11000 [Alcaligenaceae bacterium]|nr:hypothetical protein [Alcaligenaceae bacterium]